MIKNYRPIKQNPSFGSYSGNGSKKTLKGTVDKDEVLRSAKSNYSRQEIKRALDRQDIKTLRIISNKMYSDDLMYVRVVDYFANLFTYNWSVQPVLKPSVMRKFNKDELVDTWWSALEFIENINPEVAGPAIAKKVMLNGEVYIAVKEQVSRTTGESVIGLQELPLEYCRSTKKFQDRDLVDFNVKYFNEKFRAEERPLALQAFPDAISKKYLEWSAMKSQPIDSEWMTIDEKYAFRFALRRDGAPTLIGAMFDMLDLKDVKDITMFKLEQELSKILVQEFKFDKNGDLLVDLPEMEAFHAGTADMLSGVPGVDVISSLAEVKTLDLQSNSETASNNPLEKSTKNMFTTFGAPELLFNPNSAGALGKAVSVDESFMSPLLLQFQEFLTVRLLVNYDKGAKEKRIRFNAHILPVTHINRQEMAKLYTSQIASGGSKFLAKIALGQRQTEVMSSMYFENKVLELGELYDPTVDEEPTSSSKKPDSSKDTTEENGQGRPEKAVDEQSEKTIANREQLEG